MAGIGEWLNNTFLGIALQDWFLGTLAFFITFMVVRVLGGRMTRKLETFADSTKNHFDDVLIYMLTKTRGALSIILGLYSSLAIISLSAEQEKIFSGILSLLLLIMGGVWGSGVIGFIINRYVEKRVDDNAGTATTVSILGFLGKMALWTAVVLLALDNFGVDITALVAGLGIGGIAVALAAQNVLADAFASIAIALDKPFAIGDFIIIDSFMGTVERIGLKTTRIRSLSGEQLVFSNTDLLNARIRNYKQMEERRILFQFGVIYQTPSDVIDNIPTMVKEIVESESNTRFDRAHFKSFGASSLDFEVVYYMKVPDYNAYMDTQEAINLGLFKRFEKEGIEFAYPTQTLYVSNETADFSDARENGKRVTVN